MTFFQNSIIAGVLALAAISAHADTNLLNNGSFENPYMPGTNRFDAGSTGIAGWTVLGNGVDTQGVELVNTPALPASHGEQWVDLTGVYGYNKGLRSDAIVTTIGKQYLLSFDLGDYAAPGYQTSTMGVSINGGAKTLFTNIYAGGTMDWKRQTFSFIADSASTRINFIGMENGALSNNAVIGLDNVVLTAAPVPEPSTYAMMIAGLFGVAALVRRKRA
jgi:hypothetical protein